MRRTTRIAVRTPHAISRTISGDIGHLSSEFGLAPVRRRLDLGTGSGPKADYSPVLPRQPASFRHATSGLVAPSNKQSWSLLVRRRTWRFCYNLVQQTQGDTNVNHHYHP